jgi:hypothetical protein
VTSTSPFRQTLSADFILDKTAITAEGSINMNYRSFANNDRLNISNTFSEDKCLRLRWDADNLRINTDKTTLYSYSEDSDGYINEIVFKVGARQNRSFIFFKKFFSQTYGVNEFTVEKLSSCGEPIEGEFLFDGIEDLEKAGWIIEGDLEGTEIRDGIIYINDDIIAHIRRPFTTTSNSCSATLNIRRIGPGNGASVVFYQDDKEVVRGRMNIFKDDVDVFEILVDNGGSGEIITTINQNISHSLVLRINGDNVSLLVNGVIVATTTTDIRCSDFTHAGFKVVSEEDSLLEISSFNFNQNN